MVSTLEKLTTKIDGVSESILIDEIAYLTKGLLQLQHAKYPHLVPMYRTVHRKVPRPLAYRAIRWVNPKRMFPGAGMTKEEMANMTKEQLSDLIVKLNDYRAEAHVIHNRYNQMIDMINMGQLPYYIPYANIKENKWMSLQDHMDRALRLKDGTKEWENTLDQQAMDIRSLLLQKHDTKLDEIDGLWKDAEGNDAAPVFYDLKKGKGAKKFLRVQRIDSEGKRVKNPQKIYARRYLAVPDIERRKGEEVRMPAKGRLRRPSRNDRGRAIFDEHGAAAMHLARMPRGHFEVGSDARRLREQGQLISLPKGRENPVMITYSPISEENVAARRFQRVTQPERGGRHPAGAPHSRGPEGVHVEPSAEPIRIDPDWRNQPESEDTGQREERRQRRERREERRQQQEEERERLRQKADEEKARRQADEVAGIENAIRNKHDGKASPTAHVLLKERHQAMKTLYDSSFIKNHQWGTTSQFMYRDHINNPVDLANLKASDIVHVMLMTRNDTGGGGGDEVGEGGIGSRATFRMTLRDGSKIVYKMVGGENHAENLATMTDRILGLGITAGSTYLNPDIQEDANEGIGVAAIMDAFGGKGLSLEQKAAMMSKAGFNGDRLKQQLKNSGEQGHAHIMEYCAPQCMPYANAKNSQKRALVQDFENRQTIHKMALLDYVTGNKDRHHKNFMITEENKLVAIDSGFAGGYSDYFPGDTNTGEFLKIEGASFGGNDFQAGSILKSGGFNVTDGKAEAMAIFDDHFTEEAFDYLKGYGSEIGAKARQTDLTTIRSNFERYLNKIYR